MKLTHGIFGGVAAVSATLLTGCASQGPLRPPSLHLPAQASAVGIQRVADTVVVHWINPDRTTDGGDLRDRHAHALPMTAELCRQPNTQPGAQCVSIARIPATPGAAATYTDKLPAALASGPPALLNYRLRILNRNGRSADARDLLTAAGQAPPPLQNLSAAAAALGTSLGWQPVSPVTGDAVILRVQTSGASPESRAKLLRVPLTTRDPGGAIDSEGKPGDTYTAVRSRNVPLTPPDVTITLESAPASITLSTTALPPPPATPVGLVTVPSSLGGAPRIDLSWQPDTAPLRYIILRSEAGGPQQELTPTPITTFSYTDTAVRSGLAYRYSVIAVDAHGTRSKASAAETEIAPAP